MLFLRYIFLQKIQPQSIQSGRFLFAIFLFVYTLSLVMTSTFAYAKDTYGSFPQKFGDSMSPQEPAPFAPFESMVPKDAPTLDMLEMITQGGLDKLPPEVQKFLMTNKGTEPLPVLVSPLTKTQEKTTFSDKTSALAKVPQTNVPRARDPFVFGTIIPGMEPIFRPSMSLNALPTRRPLKTNTPKVDSVEQKTNIQNPNNPNSPQNKQIGNNDLEITGKNAAISDNNAKTTQDAGANAETKNISANTANTSNTSNTAKNASGNGKSENMFPVSGYGSATAPAPVLGAALASASGTNPHTNSIAYATSSTNLTKAGQNKKTTKKTTENPTGINTDIFLMQSAEQKEITPKTPAGKNPKNDFIKKEAAKNLGDVINTLNINDLKVRAENGDAIAQHKLGLKYYDGIDVKKNKEKAIEWIKKSAALDYLPAFVSMGKLWENGAFFGEENPKNAANWYKRAARKGFADAMFCLALLYDKEKLGKGESSKRLAMGYYKEAANMDHPQALYNLALFYDTNDEATRDVGQAVQLYRKSAHLGYALAQLQVGLFYESGKILPKNDTFASAWYSKAAMQGLSEAQYLLAGMYQKGQGVPKDFKKAIQLYKASANQGFVDAQFNLGLLYIVDEGAFRDEKKGEKWLQKAADQGDVQALEILADL